jgi:chemotaxis protein histidine kinase CheA
MDFTIRLRAEGTAETRAQADAVKAVRTELESTILVAKAAGVAPKAVFDAAKSKQKKEDGGAKAAEKESANAEKKRAAIEKSNAREESARKKAEDRKAKDIERATEKANKDLDRFAKDESKAAEQRAAEAIDPEMRKLSLIEKAHKNAAKKKKADEKEADEELAARIDPSLKKLSASQKAKDKLYGRMATGAMLAGAAAGAAFAGVASKLAPLAMGYMGMARLSMISAQAGFNMRRLFTGTNPKPLLDALQRTSQLIDPRTFTGKALGDLLVRSSNSFFSMLAKAEPYARLFFRGMLLGALQVEGAWLKLRLAIQPALNLFPSGIGLMTTFEAGALAVKAAFGLMGLGVALGITKAAGAVLSFGSATLAATGPLLPFVAAVVAWKEAFSQLFELIDQWDENSLSNIAEGVKRTLGITSEAEFNKNIKGVASGVSGDDYDRKYKLGKYAEKPPAGAAAVPLPKGAEKQAQPAGANIGKNLGLGMLAGMKDTQAKVETGGRDLVLAAEGGAKTAAIIQSPSRKWRKEIGRNLGEGMALGLEDSADRVDEAARATVPSAPVVSASGTSRGGIVIQSIGPFYGMPAGGEQQVRRWVIDAIDDMAERVGAMAT